MAGQNCTVILPFKGYSSAPSKRNELLSPTHPRPDRNFRKKRIFQAPSFVLRKKPYNLRCSYVGWIPCLVVFVFLPLSDYFQLFCFFLSHLFQFCVFQSRVSLIFFYRLLFHFKGLFLGQSSSWLQPSSGRNFLKLWQFCRYIFVMTDVQSSDQWFAFFKRVQPRGGRGPTPKLEPKKKHPNSVAGILPPPPLPERHLRTRRRAAGIGLSSFFRFSSLISFISFPLQSAQFQSFTGSHEPSGFFLQKGEISFSHFDQLRKSSTDSAKQKKRETQNSLLSFEIKCVGEE